MTTAGGRLCSLVVYDLETTGVDAVQDRVVQIAAILFGQGGSGADAADKPGEWRELRSFSSYVNPHPRRMAPAAQRAPRSVGSSVLRVTNVPRNAAQAQRPRRCERGQARASVAVPFFAFLTGPAAAAPPADVCTHGHSPATRPSPRGRPQRR